MKKYIVLIIFILLSLLSFAQDTVRLIHTNYTCIFSKKLEYPVYVEWWATKDKVNCSTPLKRKDNFQPDPQLPMETDLIKDYVGSGYDRGHVCPAADNLCQTPQVQDECFYFSNMIPQPHTLNAGIWKTLETYTRQLAVENDSVHVWAGAIGSVKTFGSHNVSVPSKCWKVIYIKKTKEFKSYIFDNSNEKIKDLNTCLIRIEELEKMTGFKFN
jgi:endonuclease G